MGIIYKYTQPFAEAADFLPRNAINNKSYGKWRRDTRLSSNAKIDNYGPVRIRKITSGYEYKHQTFFAHFEDEFIYIADKKCDYDITGLTTIRKKWSDDVVEEVLREAMKEHLIALGMQEEEDEKNAADNKSASNKGEEKGKHPKIDEGFDVEASFSGDTSKSEIVFQYETTYIQGNLPVAISGVKIFKDEDSGVLFACFDITSSSEVSVIAILGSARCYSVWGEELECIPTFQVLDIKTESLKTIKKVTTMILSNEEIRKINIYINQIAFKDGTIQKRTEKIAALEEGLAYQQYLMLERQTKEENNKIVRQLAQLKMLNMNTQNYSTGFLDALRASKSIYDVRKIIREAAEKYPDLFPEELLEQIKFIERKQASVGGNLKDDAVRAIDDYLKKVQAELEQ